MTITCRHPVEFRTESGCTVCKNAEKLAEEQHRLISAAGKPKTYHHGDSLSSRGGPMAKYG